MRIPWLSILVVSVTLACGKQPAAPPPGDGAAGEPVPGTTSTGVSNPPPAEICGDGTDNDRDGQVDEDCAPDQDDDGDGFTEQQGDCNDGDAAIFPGATEVTGNTVDEDCDGVANDQDGDGFDTVGGAVTDCNDLDATVFPGATEIRNDDVDQNCDGIRDWGFTKIYNDILSPGCAFSGCHQGASPPANLNMGTKSTAYANLVDAFSNEVLSLKRVAPGNADDSYLVHKLEGTQAVGARMPKTGCCLPDDRIREIRNWIDLGAAND